MKGKVLFGSLAFVVIAFIGATVGSSFYAERLYHEKLEEANNWLSQDFPDVRIVNLGYERGFFSSTGSFAIEWSARSSFMRQSILDEFPASFKGNVIRIVVNNQISTGPWLGGVRFGMAHINTVANFDPSTVPPELVQGFGNQNMFSGEMTIGYTKALSFKFNGAPLYLASSNQDSLDFRGFTATYDSSFLTKGRGNFAFNLPYFYVTLNSGRNQFLISEFSTSDQITEQSKLPFSHTYSGVMQQSLNRLWIVDDNAVFLDVEQANFTSNYQTEKELVSMQMQGEFRGSYLNQPLLGVMDFNIVNWNQAATNQFELLASVAEQGNARNRNTLWQQMESVLVDFMKTSPYLRGNFRLTYTGKTLNLQHSLGFRHITPEEMNMPVQMLFASKFYTDVNIQIPAALIRPDVVGETTYRSNIEPMIAQGMLIRRPDNTYAAEISYDGGNLTINGRRLR